MFGPSLALKADDSDAVRVASEYMRQQQFVIFNVGIVSISALFFGACSLTWSMYPIPIGAIVTVLYMFGYYVILTEGGAAFDTFVPRSDVTVDDALKGL